VLTIQERWRFKSIPNQLMIYFSHKPHALMKWATGHQWHYFGNIAGQTWTAIPRGRLTVRNQALPVLGLTLRVPVIPPSAPIRTPSESILARIVPLASRSKRLIWLAKCEACVQHDKRDKQRSVLNWHKWKLQAHKTHVLLLNIPSGLHLSINTWLFQW
jgi:hypothetical protein